MYQFDTYTHCAMITTIKLTHEKQVLKLNLGVVSGVSLPFLKKSRKLKQVRESFGNRDLSLEFCAIYNTYNTQYLLKLFIICVKCHNYTSCYKNFPHSS